jgi:hypothetical protein
MNKIFCLKFYMFCVVAIGTAQTTLSQESLTNFGVSVNGVALSIDLTNRVLVVNSVIKLSAQIKNESTNAISVTESYGREYFTVFLSSDSGKTHRQLTRKASGPSGRPYEKSVPIGGEADRIIPITITKDIEPGEYALVATRRYWSGDSSFELVSNLLKVQITK